MLRVICILCRFQHCTSLFLRCVVCVRWLVAHHSSSHTHTHRRRPFRVVVYTLVKRSCQPIPSRAHVQAVSMSWWCWQTERTNDEHIREQWHFFFWFALRYISYRLFCWFGSLERCYDRPNPMANKYRAKVQRMVIEATPKE